MGSSTRIGCLERPSSTDLRSNKVADGAIVRELYGRLDQSINMVQCILIMHKTDFLSLNGHLLRQFLLVYDLGSISQTAERLNVNQSSVSHALDRLRRIIGDPLFVRSGRSITPTAHADSLVPAARALLAELEHFTQRDTYDPGHDHGSFTIVATDYEVETVLRPLVTNLRKFAPHVMLHNRRANSTSDWTSLLRNKEVDLVLGPTMETDETDLIQQPLFQDHAVSIVDPDQGTIPGTLDAFCAASHGVMLPGRLQHTYIDLKLKELGRERKIALAAPNFSTLAAMMKGTDIIATLPSRLIQTVFSGFESGCPPIEIEPFSISQIWHSRNGASPRHRWLRACVKDLFSA